LRKIDVLLTLLIDSTVPHLRRPGTEFKYIKCPYSLAICLFTLRIISRNFKFSFIPHCSRYLRLCRRPACTRLLSHQSA